MKTIVKYAIVVLIATALGIASGAGLYWYQASRTKESFFSDQWGKVKQGVAGKAGEFLKVSSGAVHDFEVLKLGSDYSHEFILENLGDRTLEIWLVECPPTVSVDLTQDRVKVRRGASYPVAVRLNSEQNTGKFEAIIVIGVIDDQGRQDQIRLTVLGVFKGR
jgi:hypothetical protein